MCNSKINKSLKAALDILADENKRLRDLLKEQIEDSITTINLIQDVQAIKVTEAQKDIKRNFIINKKRTEYVTKIIELDKTDKLSNSRI